MRTLDNLPFSNSFAALSGGFHARLRPTPLADPHPISLSPTTAGLFDLGGAELRQLQALAALAGLTLEYGPFVFMDAYSPGVACNHSDYPARLDGECVEDALWRTAMDRVNPRYDLRDYLAQEAIAAVEQQDRESSEGLDRILARPYEDQPGCERYAREPQASWSS